MNIKEIRMKARMTQKEFAGYFDIPQRTIENWEGGQTKPASYIVDLIKYKAEKERLGMLKLIEMDHGEKTLLKEGNFKEVLRFLKENEEITNWVLGEDPKMELPNLNEVKDLQDLELELEKINLSWWGLEIE